MSHYYRCMKCRTLNTLRKALEEYARPRKCKSCQHTRFYVDKQKANRTDYCRCEGYHFTHRIKSPFCIHHAAYEYNIRVHRYGEEPLTVALEIAYDSPPSVDSSVEVPF